MSKKDKLLDCYQDLQRAASSYYLNPEGKTHLVFLTHSLKILRSANDKRLKKFENKISQLKRELIKENIKDQKKIADDILTIGLLLKRISFSR